MPSGTESTWLPKEQGIYNERSDIYSFGIVMEDLLEKVKTG